MRPSLALVLPFALTGCPAVLSDWTISGSKAVDASVDATGSEAAAGSSGSGSGGLGGSSSGSSGGSSLGGSSAGSGGIADTDGASNAGGVSNTGGMTSAGGAANTGGAGAGGTTGAGGTIGSVPACESLQGPTALGLTNAGAIGITFHSKANARLAKFVFHNGGYADTVSLEDGISCAVIDSIPIPAHVQAYTANVSWPLVANKSYRLVSSLVGQYNETQAIVAPAGWPWTDGQNLVVDDCAGGLDHCTSDASPTACGWSHQYWFNFTDLEICE